MIHAAPLLQIITQNFAQAACQPKGSVFGFPTWYKFLAGQQVLDDRSVSQCIPQVAAIADIWLIVAAVVEMLLRIAILVAIAAVVIGGVQYMSSQGVPDKTAKARTTIIQAITGLIISLGATAILTFVIGQVVKS